MNGSSLGLAGGCWRGSGAGPRQVWQTVAAVVTALPQQFGSLTSYPETRQLVPLKWQTESLTFLPALGLSALLAAAWACARGRYSARLAFAGGLVGFAVLRLLLTGSFRPVTYHGSAWFLRSNSSSVLFF